MGLDLSRQVAVITGASSGIGLGIAHALEKPVGNRSAPRSPLRRGESR
jgi:short-subunit dehydrogenase involved in D-alanine esterification of teichoic acids